MGDNGLLTAVIVIAVESVFASNTPAVHHVKTQQWTSPKGKAVLFQFQIEDAIKAARIEATEAYNQYVEEPKTSQRRGRFDLELELDVEKHVEVGVKCLACHSMVFKIKRGPTIMKIADIRAGRFFW